MNWYKLMEIIIANSESNGDVDINGVISKLSSINIIDWNELTEEAKKQIKDDMELVEEKWDE